MINIGKVFNRQNVIKSLEKFILFFVLLSFFSGIPVYLSNIIDLKILRLWKELFMLVTMLGAFLIVPKNEYKKNLKLLIPIVIFWILILINSIGVNKTVILYQFKLDLTLVLYSIGIYLFFKYSKNNNIVNMQKKILCIIVIGGIVNSLFIIFQHYFPKEFLNLIGVKFGNWGSNTGIRIITSKENIRAVGFLTGFVQAGTTMLLCIVLLYENRNKLKINKYLIFAILGLYTAALVFTTYKNGMLGLLFYIYLKIIELIKNKKYYNILLYGSTILIVVIMFLATHFYFIYSIVNKFDSYYAYSSIYMRVVFHNKILQQINNPMELLFGVGLGVNGTFGLDKAALNIKAIPTDSMYIYILSNYGLVGVAILLSILCYLIFIMFKNHQYDQLGGRYILSYLLCVEMFFNNSIINFPFNTIVILITILAFFNIKYKQKESFKRRDNND